MKIPIVLYHGKSIIFSVDAIFFHATVVTKNHSKDPQRNGTNHGTDIIYGTVLSAGLQLSTSILCRNNRFYYSLYTESHMSLASAVAIGEFAVPVDILGHFNKTVEQYNKFKAG